ncbi:hypothetical protein [Enterovibrio baiacu]|uniref:hypothetical protein n=1 Tax=Enterovibrio baiacu TaxID=2491023 RepID=UPI001F0C674B|nr:hypothetical protein [Enterovibrio baiacu]
MKKISFYFNAHKVTILLCLLALNGLLLYVAESSTVQMFGKMEALGHRWATYINLHKTELVGKAIYSKLDDAEVNLKATDYHYKYDKSKGGDYIVLGNDEPSTIRHSRAYYIDEQCSLVFSGRSEMTLLNSAFRCFY